MSHVYHPREGEDLNVILFDDCPDCKLHTEALGLSLDEDNWRDMWERMLAVELDYMGTLDNATSDSYRSANEAKLGRQMYHMYVALERYTSINPATLFAPWKLV
jgi:hypothetical protein